MAETGEMNPDVNRPIWSRDARSYHKLDSWTDPGEREVLQRIADEVRGKPILDVGVGAGRSSWFLELLSPDYVGIDYTPEMIELAREARPDVTFKLADARNLRGFEDGRFALVFFSHAGLDSLDHEDRRKALGEFHRVLQAGGLLVYSTLNRRGPFYKCGPGPVGADGRRPGPYSYARFIARAALHPVKHWRGFRNVRRSRGQYADHGDWAIDTMPTHEWGLLVHYVTTTEAQREVSAQNFGLAAMVSREGYELRPEADNTSTAWFHVIARKR